MFATSPRVECTTTQCLNFLFKSAMYCCCLFDPTDFSVRNGKLPIGKDMDTTQLFK